MQNASEPPPNERDGLLVIGLLLFIGEWLILTRIFGHTHEQDVMMLGLLCVWVLRATRDYY